MQISIPFAFEYERIDTLEMSMASRRPMIRQTVPPIVASQNHSQYGKATGCWRWCALQKTGSSFHWDHNIDDGLGAGLKPCHIDSDA